METGTFLILAIVWIGISFFVGFIGSDRKIGFLGSFFVSLLTSPIIGLLVILTSDKVERPTVEQPTILMPMDTISDGHRKASMLYKNGTKKMFNNDTMAAITEYEYAVNCFPEHTLSYYGLACCYSIKKDSVSALKNLKLAFKCGYNSIDNVKNDKELSFLRTQDEYKIFAAGGFLVEAPPIQTNPDASKYELLEKIGKLKQDGILSQGEFEKEKDKIMSMS